MVMKRNNKMKQLRRMKRNLEITINGLEKLSKSWNKAIEIGEKLYDDGLLILEDGDVKLNGSGEGKQGDTENLNDILLAVNESIDNLKDLDSMDGDKIK